MMLVTMIPSAIDFGSDMLAASSDARNFGFKDLNKAEFKDKKDLFIPLHPMAMPEVCLQILVHPSNKAKFNSMNVLGDLRKKLKEIILSNLSQDDKISKMRELLEKDTGTTASVSAVANLLKDLGYVSFEKPEEEKSAARKFFEEKTGLKLSDISPDDYRLDLTKTRDLFK
jgi:hypothetical protein